MPAKSPAPKRSAATKSFAAAVPSAPAKSAAPGRSAAPAKSAAPGRSAAPAKSAAPGRSAAPAKSAAPGRSAAPAGFAAAVPSAPPPSAAILAAGDFPRHPLARAALDSARHLVCCDGAARALARRSTRVPDAVVGDFDSLPPSLLRRWPAAVFHRVDEQETNDLSKAFRFCLSRRWRDLVILGASGGREDHFLGNFALLADFSALAPRVRMLTDHGLFFVVRAPARFRCGAGRRISLFSLDPAQRLSAEGLRYPVRDLSLSTLWRATLNIADQDVVTLRPATPSPVIVYLCHPSA